MLSLYRMASTYVSWAVVSYRWKVAMGRQVYRDHPRAVWFGE